MNLINYPTGKQMRIVSGSSDYIGFIDGAVYDLKGYFIGEGVKYYVLLKTEFGKDIVLNECWLEELDDLS